MEQACHRCGENLVPDELFCPHCGAPQLRVEDSESVPAAQEGSLQQSLERSADMMRWRSAVSLALSVAVPVALISAVLSLGVLWVFAGGFVVVSLYRRRTASPTNGRIGWRIGGLMGVISAILWLVFSALSTLVQRYALHQKPLIVAALRQSIRTSLATVSQQNPDFAKQVPWVSHFWLSPDGLATLYLLGVCIFALAMVLFSALGGAVGGVYQRNRPVNPPPM